MPFTEFDFLQKYRESFKLSEVGRIHELLPLKEMADEIQSRRPWKNPRGNKPAFPPEGEIALMFLKPYTGLSDDGLIEMLNGSLHMQMFCGVLIDPSNPIKDGKIVSAIRNRLAPYLDIRTTQKILYGKWSPELADKDMFLTDATCYESNLRYPTDVKLLWECCEWLHDLLREKFRMIGEPMSRSKYHDVSKARLVYAKQRKPRKSETRKLMRRLLHLLEKLLREWNRLNKIAGGLILLTVEQNKRLTACRHGGKLWQPKATLQPDAHSSTQQTQRDSAAFLRHPYGQRRHACSPADSQRATGKEESLTIITKIH